MKSKAATCAAPVMVVALLFTACVGPSRTTADYRAKAANTAEAASSAVATARLTADMTVRGKTLAPYASLTLSRSESDLESITTGFSAVQPPSARAERIRAEVLSVLSEARTVLSDLRIAARQGESKRLADLVLEAERLAVTLTRLEEEIGP